LQGRRACIARAVWLGVSSSVARHDCSGEGKDLLWYHEEVWCDFEELEWFLKSAGCMEGRWFTYIVNSKDVFKAPWVCCRGALLGTTMAYESQEHLRDLSGDRLYRNLIPPLHMHGFCRFILLPSLIHGPLWWLFCPFGLVTPHKFEVPGLR
jgi:hypothetical protein